MLFHIRLTHSPGNCWARDENEGKGSEFIERMEDATESLDVTVQSAHVAPNEHTFYLMAEANSFASLTALLGPPLLQDHEADVVPVETFGDVMDTLDVE